MTQPTLASRVGRTQARISEFERDLTTARMGRDRLTLLVEICDALNLTPFLVPQNQVETVRQVLNATAPSPSGREPITFDDVFVDLSDSEDDQHG
jgi:hypothetical protein